MSARKFVIDLRSDTVTKPTAAMRKAMFEAEVGDDVFREDPTVKELESYAAKLTGKEGGLFLPTATMGNLASIMSHCYIRGQEVLVGDQSHIHLNEQGGIAQLAGLHHRTLTTRPDGTLDLQEAVEKIRANDCHYPITGLLCLENTHNFCGGTVLPYDYIQNAGQFCKGHGIPLHMDGARIMNATVHLGMSAEDLLRPCDSVTICLSKGLGAPAGALITGNNEFITRALRCRKVLGGGMRQAGVVAAAGLVALKDMVNRLSIDHDHARNFALEINKCGSEFVSVNMGTVQSNMAFASIDKRALSPEEFCQRLAMTTENEVEELEAEVCIKIFSVRSANNYVRFVFHYDISEEEAKLAAQKVSYVIREMDKTP